MFLYVVVLLGYDSDIFCGCVLINIVVVVCFFYDNVKERYYKINIDNNDF